jgi:hypothetical protein
MKQRDAVFISNGTVGRKGGAIQTCASINNIEISCRSFLFVDNAQYNITATPTTSFSTIQDNQ